MPHHEARSFVLLSPVLPRPARRATSDVKAGMHELGALAARRRIIFRI